MKARRIGTKEFKEIGTVTFVDDNWSVFHAENLEFEQQQEPIPDHWQDVRERAAIVALGGLLADWNIDGDGERDKVTKVAIDYADALVKKLKGE